MVIRALHQCFEISRPFIMSTAPPPRAGPAGVAQAPAPPAAAGAHVAPPPPAQAAAAAGQAAAPVPAQQGGYVPSWRQPAPRPRAAPKAGGQRGALS